MYKEGKMTIRDKKIAMKKIVFSTSFRLLLSSFVFIFGILYVVNASDISTKGYNITELKKEIVELERENQKLDFNIAKNSSMESIQNRLEDTDLIVSEDVEYSSVVGNTVALR